MDVRTQSRERVFSILNDNDCPSFVIRPRRVTLVPQSSHSPSPTQRRPSLVRQAQYKRSSSFSSTSSASPPLLRYNSASSKSSNSSMDSSPSPITPAYYNDTALLPYDVIPRQDLASYIPSPSTITPFMEQQMMIAPISDPFSTKTVPLVPTFQYPIVPAPLQPEVAQLPPPTSLASAPNSIPASSAPNSTSPNESAPNVKKNKYPCPYAQSHNCSATFTTSGHAARHGKKHTGEKGVHCPVCNKAFTRKDNMKQHERTHKNSISGRSNSHGLNSRKNKAAISREAQKTKQLQKSESSGSDPTNQPSLLHSPLSEVTSVAPSLDMPIGMEDQQFFPTVSAAQLMPAIPIQSLSENVSPNALFRPTTDEALQAASNAILPLPPLTEKLIDVNGLPPIPMPPTLVRGFSHLDTLAQAAETFDPYYQPTI